MRRFWHYFVRVAAAIIVVLLIAVLAGVVVVQSGWFHEYVRRQIIAQIEKATGGRVELGKFSFRAPSLTAQVSPLVLHGKEGEGEAPLLRIDSIKIGLRVLSFMERRVDLAAVQVDQPRLHIVMYPDGTDNLPSPAERAAGKPWSEDLINLAVRQYQISNGLVDYDDREIPLNLRGEDLEIRMNYDARTPAYRGELSSGKARLLTDLFPPVEAGVAATFSLEKQRVAFSRVRVTTQESRADLTGELRDLRAPRGQFTVKAAATAGDLVRMFGIPVEPVGSGSFDGKLSVAFVKPFDFAISGRFSAKGVGYAMDRVKIEGVDVSGNADLKPGTLTLTSLRATALGGSFTGSGSLTHWRRFHLEGAVQDLTLAEAAKLGTPRALPWNGTLAGDAVIDTTIGRPDTEAHASILITPIAGSPPMEGRVNVSYSQASGDIALEPSYLSTAATQLDVSGTLSRRLQVQFRSTNLDDLLPAWSMLDASAPKQFPLQMNNGIATAQGAVLGTVDDARFQGEVNVTNGSVEGHGFDRLAATVDASRATVDASKFTIARGATEATGSASISAREGRFGDGALAAQVAVRNVDLAAVLKEAGQSLDVMGTASGSLKISGTVDQPQAEGSVDVMQVAAFGEQADRVRANLKASAAGIEVAGGTAEAGPARAQFSGSYRHDAAGWRSGNLQVQAAVQNLTASRVKAVAAAQPRVDAKVNGTVRAEGHVRSGGFTLASAEGSAVAQAVTVDRQAVGDVTVTAETNAGAVLLRAMGDLRGSPFAGEGSWKLEGDEPGSATIRVSRMDLATIHSLAMLAGTAEQQRTELPFAGFVEGHARISAALRHPQDFQAEVTLDTIQFNAKPDQALQLGVQPQDLVLKNSQPVVVDLNSKEANIAAAHFTGRDTNIEATGRIPMGGGNTDLTVRGTVNLIVLQLLNPNLLAQGTATVQAAVRGALLNPTVNGRMQLSGASLFLKDLPNEVENAKGVILFDTNRATIQELTAETGGGKISFSGFLGFASPLTYRLQANVQQVRVRLPNEVSVTSNASLALNGTSDASTLSGSVTLLRAAFSPRTDLLKLLSSAKPVPSVAPNEYLRGMQFDVRIQSDPSFEFETSLTHDVESEVDLRLRGNIVQPVLLGTVSADSGEVELLGTRYTIDRADVRFVNPVKIAPSFDIEIETRARGVTVNISLSGTSDKFVPNYSSDPPLQPAEIIALLAVGRDPNASLGSLASAQSASSSSDFISAGGGLLSQALTAQLSSKVQRFLGSSRVKIDPTMTGVDTTPQARLTFEQQVSKDITLTYITNLNYTAEQIVRLEWDVNRKWSAVAVRDSNGLFGIDFQYRKRLK